MAETVEIDMEWVHAGLRDRGLKCVCADCDAFGCDNCTICSLNEDEANNLLNDIRNIEIKYSVSICSILNNR